MAILFMEGMDGWSTQAQAARRGMYSNGLFYQEPTLGRFGGGALNPCGSGGSGVSPMYINFSSASDTIFMAWAQKVVVNNGSGYTVSLWRNWSGAVNVGGGANTCFTLQGISGGTIGVYSASGALYGTFPVNPDSIWHWWSVKAVCLGGTSGSIEIYMDGNLVYSKTGANFAGASATGNNYSFGMSTRGGSAEYPDYGIIDDLIIADNTGTHNNTVIADSRIITRWPTTLDTAGAWTANTGTIPAALDENPGQDDDTTYITSSTAADEFFVGFANMAVTPASILAVKATLIARKTGAEGTTLTPEVKSGSTIGAGSAQGMTTAYNGIPSIFETDPATAAPWTVAATNALKVGGKLS